MASNPDKELTIPLKKRKAVTTAPTLPNGKTAIDLQEWIGTRVLARYGSGYSIFRPGKIIACPSAGSLRVLLDKQDDPITFSNVFDSLEILGNYSPAANLVTTGCSVCVKEKPEDNLFVVAKVVQIDAGPPPRYSVKSENLPNDIWTNRANIRLMQPPWHDDLLEAVTNQHVSVSLLYSCVTLRGGGGQRGTHI